MQNNRPIRAIALLAAAMCLWLAPPSLANEYAITLKRPSKVGDQFEAKYRTTFKTQGGAKPTQFTAELEGVIKVLAVNEMTGSATHLSCDVKRLTKDGKELYPAGTTVTGKMANHAYEFKINGQDVGADNVLVLRNLLSLSDPSTTVSEDDSLGTKEGQKVGGSWPVNSQNIAKELQDDGLAIDPVNITGEGRLVAIEKLGEVEATVLSWSVAGTKSHMISKDGQRIVDGSFKMTFEVKAPIDPSIPPPYVKISHHLSNVISNRSGTVKTDVVVDTETVREITILNRP